MLYRKTVPGSGNKSNYNHNDCSVSGESGIAQAFRN